ncbi:MAG: iron-sulfur cluster assembly accessory protein [Bacteroidetes bacterium]|nr:MAG: iron-sulfur cluster assembly accessory protein [Bacteroidota bacterium]
MAEVMTHIHLTDSAIEELKKIRVAEGFTEDKPVRIGVKGGGCSGLSYVMEFDEQREFDEVYEFAGLPVVVDQRQLIYIMGMEVDYQYGLNDRGFIFRNPNASTTCGCGTSFSA